MAYEDKEARQLIIKAGLELINNHLIARTWGNISARISKDEFIITPSGRSYESLIENDLVIIRIEDASYSGDIKPSSEKTLHAKAYALREDCQFIIHTHQPYATALSVNGESFSFAPCAKYGLPGTKKLAKNTAKVIEDNKEAQTFLMERHGVLCLGASYEEAFENAYSLETKAKEEYEKNHQEKKELQMKPFLDDFAQMYGLKGKAVEDDETALALIKEKNALAANYSKTNKSMKTFDVLLQNFVYKKKYSKLKSKK